MAPTDLDLPPTLPDIDALLAGTLALMTAWADPCPASPLAAADLRRLLARKVVSNLYILAHHPLARPALQQSLDQARQRWIGLAHPGAAAEGVPAARAQALH